MFQKCLKETFTSSTPIHKKFSNHSFKPFENFLLDQLTITYLSTCQTFENQLFNGALQNSSSEKFRKIPREKPEFFKNVLDFHSTRKESNTNILQGFYQRNSATLLLTKYLKC